MPESVVLAPPPPRRRRRFRFLPITGIALLLFYVASPYWALWRFVEAVESSDAAALSRRVDFADVRAAMKRQLRAHFFPENPEQKRAKKNRLNAIVTQLGPTLIDGLVDSYLTPDGLAALVMNPTITSVASRPDPPSPLAVRSGHPHGVPWSKIHFASFVGLNEFLVDLNGTKLHFRVDLAGWRVHRVDLALDEPSHS